MPRRTDEQRVALARWLMVNAHRLSSGPPRRTPKQVRASTDAELEWHRARHLLWTAAAKLMAFEIGEDDGC